jgi:hypothetical protein
MNNNHGNNIKTYTDEEIEQINTYIDNLDYETARLLLTNRLKKDPDDVEALDLLSEVLVNIGEEPEAVKVYTIFYLGHQTLYRIRT